jgi:glycerophosphoryl diester phosphodiesterase
MEANGESIYDVISRVGGFPLHCAHRGGCGSDFGPENTMYSFRKSVLYKTKLLEIDLRVTKDGHLVIMHGML